MHQPQNPPRKAVLFFRQCWAPNTALIILEFRSVVLLLQNLISAK
jgi:hypothetical protein